MKLTYKNDKLKSLCEDASSLKELKKEYGDDVARKLPQRIKELKAFESVNDIPISPPFRRHKLKGDRDGEFAITIAGKNRLIFISQDNNIITDDLRNIKEIKIMEVSKHYE